MLWPVFIIQFSQFGNLCSITLLVLKNNHFKTNNIFFSGKKILKRMKVLNVIKYNKRQFSCLE